MLRVRVVGTGWTGAPGLTTFYFSTGAVTPADITALLTRVRLFFTNAAATWANSTTWTIDPEVAEIDPITGDQTSTYVSQGALSPVAGTGGLGQAPPATQLLLRLVTAAFVGGRRVRGHSFIGPVASTVIQGDGTPLATSISTLASAGTALADVGGPSPDMLVWSRPTLLRVGTTWTVIGVSVPDKFAVLRSRRD